MTQDKQDVVCLILTTGELELLLSTVRDLRLQLSKSGANVDQMGNVERLRDTLLDILTAGRDAQRHADWYPDTDEPDEDEDDSDNFGFDEDDYIAECWIECAARDRRTA